MSTLARLTIDTESATPPFEQVRTHIAAAIASGLLDAGTKLPTVRRLAADLGLAANTVARAYRELEADAVIATHGRRGTFVRSDVLDQPTVGSSVADSAGAAATNYVRAVRRLGLSSQEAVRLVENTWNQGGLIARPGSYQGAEGVDGQPGQPADDGAVDADEL